jgi:hypothetical protein
MTGVTKVATNLLVVDVEIHLNLRLRGIGVRCEPPTGDRVLCRDDEQRVTGLDLCARDRAVGLNSYQEDYLAAYVHAPGKFRVGWRHTRDDGTVDRSRERTAGAKSNTSGK